MLVRRLQNKEILEGLRLVWKVFAEANAPHMTPEGVASFQEFIKMENFMPKVESGEIAVFGAINGNELAGVCAVRRDGHISLLFVKKCWQRRGVAKMMMREAIGYCVFGLHVKRMTVNAAPQAVEAYRHLGFTEAQAEQEQNGVRYIPMECMLPSIGVNSESEGRSHRGMFIGAGIVIAILMGVLVFSMGKMVATVADNAGELKKQFLQDPNLGEGEPKGEQPSENPGESDEEETGKNVGIDGIECYVAENLPYTIKEETYTYSSDGYSGEYPMEFEVTYPQLEGMDSPKADEINKMLKDCAMSTVDTLYLNPSDAAKEAMIRQEKPFIASQVKYKITYAGEDFISVVFSDHCFVGNMYAEYQDLRTRNIRLSDGTRFETTDIVELTSDFMTDWMARMKKEAPGAEVLTGLRMTQFRKILNGEILENRYYDNFFVDKDGVEIGLTYHYINEEQTLTANGWITAPFTMKEIMEYKTDNDFWNLVQSNN